MVEGKEAKASQHPVLHDPFPTLPSYSQSRTVLPEIKATSHNPASPKT
jgi:hypothetical protein